MPLFVTPALKKGLSNVQIVDYDSNKIIWGASKDSNKSQVFVDQEDQWYVLKVSKEAVTTNLANTEC